MKYTKLFFSLLLSFLLAQESPALSTKRSIEGDWFGIADPGNMKLRLTLHVRSAGEGYASTWDSPDQEISDLASTKTTFSYPDFMFSSDEAGLKFKGIVDREYSEISGFLAQGNSMVDITFKRTPIPPPPGSFTLVRDKYEKKEVYITMRDGVRLFTSIYTPRDHKTHPVLLNRTPYDIEPGGEKGFNWMMRVYSRYTDAGYIMVFQDVRGRYMSEGSFEDIRPFNPDKKSNKDIDESTDTWDTVDWLVKNVQGNNGRVGIFGISYPGFYSTMGIIGAHPAVKAISPQAPVTAWFKGDDFHHNGAFFIMDFFGFYYNNGRAFAKPTRSGFPEFVYPVQDNYEFFLSLGAVKNIKTRYFGDTIKFWNDASAHPDYDEFWKSRDPRQYLKNVTPAVMTVGGWFDAEDLYGALHVYQAIEQQNPQTVKNTLVMGPWSHGQWAYGEGEKLGNIKWGQDANRKFVEYEKQFFDYYLNGEGNGDFPEALTFITGKNEWQTFDSWPPKNTSQKSLYLNVGGKISLTIPEATDSFDEYISDPSKPVPYAEHVHLNRTTAYMTDDQRFAARRPDVMVYQTDILTDDITVTGPLTADLFVSTSGTDADYIVKLIDVFPPDAKNPADPEITVPLGGYQMLVRGEVFRGRYRNSFEKPEPFTPGMVSEVRYDLPDIAHTFGKGHRIMIQVQNSWFPLVDRNPQKFVNIYECSDSDFQKATERIYHESAHPSRLIVNILQDQISQVNK
jgi:uncharacterized protein